jgi:hypothetical protein
MTLYRFEGQAGGDGAQPLGSLAIGWNGALYGTTNQGGSTRGGTVFELNAPLSTGASSISGCAVAEEVLYSFPFQPLAGPSSVVLTEDGVVYGTTQFGGWLRNDLSVDTAKFCQQDVGRNRSLSVHGR